jgi:predicted cupin superfamily sugar epimerase
MTSIIKDFKMNNLEYWIQHLGLLPHPEGGFYKETFRSSISIDKKMLPLGYKDSRRLVTSIYYLLRSGDISHFHRLRSDELWYYHYGSSIRIIIIDQEGHKQTKILGPRIEKAEHLQVTIPAGTIFGAEVIDSSSFGLFGCVVAPGFEFDDFEIYSKEDLKQAYPKHADLIEKFGR